MVVEWKDSNGQTHEAKFTERDIHTKDEKTLLNYWRRLGGRKKNSGLEPDVIHLFKILGEERDGNELKWKVQFVGYSAKKPYLYTPEQVKEIYVELYEDWMNRHP
ncbi:hypothetical protein IL306_000348 [Fusarium sp. DS 682]|nr:hypothetical protein IL306_000348 [Fusarium sp. DS 682]